MVEGLAKAATDLTSMEGLGIMASWSVSTRAQGTRRHIGEIPTRASRVFTPELRSTSTLTLQLMHSEAVPTEAQRGRCGAATGFGCPRTQRAQVPHLASTAHPVDHHRRLLGHRRTRPCGA